MLSGVVEYIHVGKIMGPCGAILDGWLKMEMCWPVYSYTVVCGRIG